MNAQRVCPQHRHVLQEVERTHETLLRCPEGHYVDRWIVIDFDRQCVVGTSGGDGPSKSTLRRQISPPSYRAAENARRRILKVDAAEQMQRLEAAQARRRGRTETLHRDTDTIEVA